MGRKRIEMFVYRHVLVRLRAKDSDRQIAAQGLMGRHKVAEFRQFAHAQGWLDPTVDLVDEATIIQALHQHKPAVRAQQMVSKAEPWRDLIQEWVNTGVQGSVIHQTLVREHSFSGSYSSVRRLAQQFREKPADLTVRLSFEPGEAAQVDFGAGPFLMHPDGVLRRTWAFVMTLCYSRHQYAQFVWDQTVATWLGCHRRAFEWFNGVPQRLIIDNAKCAVIKACIHSPVIHRSYLDCAEGYGFRIDPCPPRDPQKKGIVESGVKYLKGNFLPLRTFRDLSDLNVQARAWVMEVAGVRQHGTTYTKPLTLFGLERNALQPLPPQAPDLGVWQPVKVYRDGHVKFGQNWYSVPCSLVGQSLWLRATDTCVSLYQDGRWVCTHPKSLCPGERVTVQAHLPPDAQAFFAHDAPWLTEQATAIGPACLQLVQSLLNDPAVVYLRAAQSVIALAKVYPSERIEAACVRAWVFNSPCYQTVKSILKNSADLLPPVAMETPKVYGQSRFVRPASTLFESAKDDFPH